MVLIVYNITVSLFAADITARITHNNHITGNANNTVNMHGNITSDYLLLPLTAPTFFLTILPIFGANIAAHMTP